MLNSVQVGSGPRITMTSLSHDVRLGNFVLNYVRYTLAKWPRRGDEVFTLSIETQSPDDKSAQTPEAWEERRLRARESHDFLDKRFEISWLRFDEKLVGVRCASVPLVTCLVVTGGQIRRDDLRKIEPVSCSFIMAKLPRLDHLTLYLDDRCTWNPELRYRHRKGMLHKVRT